MADVAIDRLSRAPDGFFLMLEGARIDHGHHDNSAARALSETRELSKAVATILEKVDINETLIIVTSDHSHGFVMTGSYAKRGNPILGLLSNVGAPPVAKLATDKKPFTTVGYYDGESAITGERADLSHVDVEGKDFRQQAAIPADYESHSGEDVAVFAIGPWAHLFRGTMEQNVIFHIMKHASDFDD